MQPSDLLLGRKTFKIWEDYWPKHTNYWPSINTVTKYILSTTVTKSDWQNTVFINGIEDIKQIKNSDGSDFQVWGSSELIQLLLKNDLIDELWLFIHPLTLGKGKKLFIDGAIPASFTLKESVVTSKGLIMANFSRAGNVKTGTSGS